MYVCVHLFCSLFTHLHRDTWTHPCVCEFAAVLSSPLLQSSRQPRPAAEDEARRETLLKPMRILVLDEVDALLPPRATELIKELTKKQAKKKFESVDYKERRQPRWCKWECPQPSGFCSLFLNPIFGASSVNRCIFATEKRSKVSDQNSQQKHTVGMQLF